MSFLGKSYAKFYFIILGQIFILNEALYTFFDLTTIIKIIYLWLTILDSMQSKDFIGFKMTHL